MFFRPTAPDHLAVDGASLAEGQVNIPFTAGACVIKQKELGGRHN